MLNFLRNDVNNRTINYLMAYSYIKENESLYFQNAIKYLKNVIHLEILTMNLSFTCLS